MSSILEQPNPTEPTDERKAEILDHRIDMLNEKILCFQKFSVSYRKLTKLTTQRDAFIAARAALSV